MSAVLHMSSSLGLNIIRRYVLTQLRIKLASIRDECKKRTATISIRHIARGQQYSYYNAVSWVSVDIEDALNAGHSVDPESGMQLCAKTVGTVKARNKKSIAGFIVALSVFSRPRLFLRRTADCIVSIRLY